MVYPQNYNRKALEKDTSINPKDLLQTLSTRRLSPSVAPGLPGPWRRALALGKDGPGRQCGEGMWWKRHAEIVCS